MTKSYHADPAPATVDWLRYEEACLPNFASLRLRGIMKFLLALFLALNLALSIAADLVKTDT
jgi:hypothetical protein